ncbi:MAG: hypothetical protein ACRDV1_00010 [Actinomycetes bacterium]
MTTSDSDNGRSSSGETPAPGTAPGSEGSVPAPRPPGAPSDTDVELEQTQAEVAALRARLDSRARRGRRLRSARGVIAALLVVLAAFGATASVIGLWAGRTTLNTDRWVQTVTPLAEDPAVKAAMTAYLSEQIYDSLDVPARVSEVLPPRAAFLAQPLSSRVESYLQTSVRRVLDSEAFAQLWPEVNRFAHERIMAIVNNEGPVLQRSGNVVTLNLLPVVNEVLRLLEQQVPTIFGKTVDLPQVSSGEVPPGLENRIETALGVTLPDSFAKVTIYRGDELASVQDAVVAFKRFIVLFALGSLVLLGLALWISPHRRRTILQYGVWLALLVLALRSIRAVVRDQVLETLPAGVYREGADAAVQIVFSTLRERGTQVLWLGILMAAAAYLSGPGKAAIWLRRQTAHAARSTAAGTRRFASIAVADGPDFARSHLDPLRIGGVVVAAAVAFLLSSWTSLLVVVVLLGAYELLVTLAAGAASGPAEADTGEGEASADQQAAPVADPPRPVDVR